MADWNVDKLKEILCPLGYECSPLERSVRADGQDYFFEIPGTPVSEYFIRFTEKTNTLVVYPVYGEVQGSKTCNINEIRFDLVQWAKNYITSYKEKIIAEKKNSLEKDFKNVK